MNKQQGFTLIEMIVVMAIIAIVAMMAMPSPDPTFARRQVQEGMTLTQDYQDLVAFYHKSNLVFLKNNQEAGIPPADKLLGNYVDRIELLDGAFHIHFGNKAHNSITNKTLSIRPIVVNGSPESPISWICGLARIPEGMSAAGENRTDIDIKDLPILCRI